MDGPWMVSVWAQLGFHSDGYAVAAHPMPDDTPRGALSQRYSQYAYWLSSQSTHQAEAFKFMQWVTNPTGFFVQNFLKNSFATLAFADNKKYLTDPAWKSVFKIADTRAFRVLYPEPLLKCPGLADSKAFTMASTTRPNGEWEVMVQNLVNNRDMTGDARALVNMRQTTFETQLQKEQASGLKVSKDCYTFAGWNYDQDFNPANYPKS
jgi:ABC-type glycerol-3-phosphate transport system substrate-binding protein